VEREKRPLILFLF